MMKMLFWSVLAAALLAASGPLTAQSSYRCPGFEPHAPPGCSGPPRCWCTADGECKWWFDCDKD